MIQIKNPHQDNYKYRMGLAIMFHVGKDEIPPEAEKEMLDLEGEYNLIKDGKSKLSRARRDEVEYVWESILREKEIIKANKEKEADEEVSEVSE